MGQVLPCKNYGGTKSDPGTCTDATNDNSFRIKAFNKFICIFKYVFHCDCTFNLWPRTWKPRNSSKINCKYISFTFDRHLANLPHTILYIKTNSAAAMRINDCTLIRALILHRIFGFVSLDLVDSDELVRLKFVFNIRQCVLERNSEPCHFAIVDCLLPGGVRLITSLQRPLHRLPILFKSLLILWNVQIIFIILCNLIPCF